IADKVAKAETVLIAAFLDDRIVGTAQLGLDMPPNQPHRAEVRKMLVHHDGRRQGIAGAMLQRLEDEARARGRSLLI
ncbi:GNAT family N-acetyltransferase, partial [Klebsiella aerogenes]|uniref:GNAT family N-acetyltransferase n=1 Tax=Klebsiella aerogenes TaxID=548 RepID=UPI0013D05831